MPNYPNPQIKSSTDSQVAPTPPALLKPHVFPDYSPGSEVSVESMGIAADNSTDDTVALQTALLALAPYNTYLNGQGKTCRISGPVFIPNGARLRNIKSQSAPTFQLAASGPSPMFLTFDGNVCAFSVGLDSNNAQAIICTSGHGIATGSSGNGVPVMLRSTQGSMVGASEATIYYATNITNSTTLELASTIANALAGISDVQPSAGNGTIFCHIIGTLAQILIDGYFYVNCANVAGVSGAMFAVQQPGQINTMRCDNAAAGCFGLWLTAQQQQILNFESIGCDTGLLCEAAKIVWISGLDIEQCVTRAVGTNPAQTYTNSGGGLDSFLVMGSHHEVSNGVKIWDLTNNGGGNLTLINPWLTTPVGAGTTGSFIYAPNGASYVIIGATGTLPGSAGHLFINDINMQRDSWTDYHQVPPSLIIQPTIPQSANYPFYSFDFGGGSSNFGGGISRNRTLVNPTVGTPNYGQKVADDIIEYQTLPVASEVLLLDMTTLRDGVELWIIDGPGLAGTHNITLKAVNGQTINFGAAQTFVMNTNHQVVRLCSNRTALDWRVV